MRVVTRVASALLGIALVVGGALLVVYVVVAAFGRQSMLPGQGVYAGWVDARLNDDRTILVATGVAVLGLVILISQLIPRRPSRVPSTIDDGWFLPRRAVERQVGRAAGAEPAVTGAKAAIRRRRGRWRTTVTARANRTADTGVREAEAGVRERAHRVLGRMTVPDGPVRVVLQRRSP